MGWRLSIVLSGMALGAMASGVAAGQSVAPLALGAPLASSPTAPGSRLRIAGQKFAAPHFQRTEAGIGWSLNERVTIQLHYERGAYAPLMRHDHDDGLLTRLKLTF